MKKERKRSSGCARKLPSGTVLCDMRKDSWLLGPHIGAGSFGDVYFVSSNLKKPVTATNAMYAVKVESISSGPLFVEMNFYLRVAIKEKVEKWKEECKMKHLGMPHLVAFGSHTLGPEKYRFLIIPRYGEDIASIFTKCGRKFSLKTGITIGLQIIEVIRYIHYNGYVHADIKGANLMLGPEPGGRDKVYLIDFGLACSYVDKSGRHKQYEQDRRRAHAGTIEYTSRDAHVGAYSRRGDFEVLGYNLVEWISGKLPWSSSNLDQDQIAAAKNFYMDNLPQFMSECFNRGETPAVLENYLKHVQSLSFTSNPDYEGQKRMMIEGLKEANVPHDGKLNFTMTRSRASKTNERGSDRENNPQELTIRPRTRSLLRPLQISQRRTRRVSAKNEENAEFDWVKVIESHPERLNKSIRLRDEPVQNPTLINVDPSLKEPRYNPIAFPTAAMMKIMYKWLIEMALNRIPPTAGQSEVLMSWSHSWNIPYKGNPFKTHGPGNGSKDRNAKPVIVDEITLSSKITAKIIKKGNNTFIGVSNQLIGTKSLETIFRSWQFKKITITPSNNTANKKKDEALPAEKNNNDVVQDDEEEDAASAVQAPVYDDEVPRVNMDKIRAKMDEEGKRARSRSRSLDRAYAWQTRFRNTPARRQRSVTPFDTFYTPYRGPSPSRSRSPPRKRGRPRRRSISPSRKTSSSRKESRFRSERTPSPRRTGRSSKKELERRRERSPSPKRHCTRSSKKDSDRYSRSRYEQTPSPHRKRSRSRKRVRTPSPKRRPGRPSKKELERRARNNRARSPSPPKRRGRPAKKTKSRDSRSPSPYKRSKSYNEYSDRQKRLSRKDLALRAVYGSRSITPYPSPERKRGKSHRRSSSRHSDYSGVDILISPNYSSRSKSRPRHDCKESKRGKTKERSRSRSRRSKRKRSPSEEEYRPRGHRTTSTKRRTENRSRKSQSRHY